LNSDKDPPAATKHAIVIMPRRADPSALPSPAHLHGRAPTDIRVASNCAIVIRFRSQTRTKVRFTNENDYII